MSTFPKLSDKLTQDDLPEELELVSNSSGNLLDRILVKQAVTNRDPYSNVVSFYYELGYQNAGQEAPIEINGRS